MTEMLKKEFSRKSFVKGGGAMIVAFSVVGAGVGAKAAKAASDPYASNGPFDQISVDSWLTIHADNTASLKMGKVEMGQGTPTALLMIAAEELDMEPRPDEADLPRHERDAEPGRERRQPGRADGRQADPCRGCRCARARCSTSPPRTSASRRRASRVKGGVVSGGGKTVTYGDLIGDKLFNVKITGFSAAGNATTPAQAVAGSPGTKPVSQYTIVGTSPPRIDIPDKVTGKMTYVHNIRVPGMLHGRIVRPRGQGAYGDGTSPKVLSVDESSIKHIEGAKVVRFGDDFLGVVAEHEYSAIQAAAQLKVKWAEMPPISELGQPLEGHARPGQRRARRRRGSR